MSMEQSIQNLADAINNMAKAFKTNTGELVSGVALTHTCCKSHTEEAAAPLKNTRTIDDPKPDAQPAKTPAAKEEPKAETSAPLTNAMKLPDGKYAKRFLKLTTVKDGHAKQSALLAQFGAKTLAKVKEEDIPAFAEALEAAFVAQPETEVIRPEAGEVIEKTDAELRAEAFNNPKTDDASLPVGDCRDMVLKLSALSKQPEIKAILATFGTVAKGSDLPTGDIPAWRAALVKLMHESGAK